MTDANEIIHALRLWFQAGDVFEVRVLDAVSADYRREHIESGYFDYEHISAVPEALKRLLSFRGVYVTVNPVNPDLLARAVNRLRPAGRNPTTADTDIVRRRWLLIDCDPRRASGVSSSNLEHDFALAKAREIRDGLSSLGWPKPVLTDSGNGAQLMYRIDLPADDGELVWRNRKGLVRTGCNRHIGSQSRANLAASRNDELQGRLHPRTSAPHGKAPGSSRQSSGGFRDAAAGCRRMG